MRERSTESPTTGPESLAGRADTRWTTLAVRGLMWWEGFVGRPEHLPLVVHVIIVVAILYIVSLAAYFGLGPADVSFAGLWPITVLFFAFFVAGAIAAHWYESSLVGRLTQEGKQLAMLLGFSAGREKQPRGEVRFFVPSCDTTFSPREHLSYHVRALAMGDVCAVVELAQMLARSNLAFGSGNISSANLFIEDVEVRRFSEGTLFHVGGPLPNVHVEDMIAQSPLVGYEDHMAQDGTIAIVVKQPVRREFAMRPPWHDRSILDTESESTYGCVMRDSTIGRPRFAVWGLDARGTVGAARWLAQTWHKLPEYRIRLGEDFVAVMRILPRVEIAEAPVRVSEEHALLAPA